MTSTEITPTAGMPAPDGLQMQLVNVLPYAYWPMGQRWQYAKALAGAKELLPAGLRAGSLEDTTAKVFLVMETGAMLGLHPMAAFQGIDVIEGNATISPETAAALIRGAGHELDFAESGTIRGGDYTVTWTLQRMKNGEPAGKPISASWAIEDSVQAGLVELIGAPGEYKVKALSRNGNPLNHQLYPKDMTQWRALGRLMRRGASDITMGLSYFPEELQVAITDGGSIHRDLSVEEDAIIAEFIGGEGVDPVNDKADMERIWQAHHNRDAWTDRVEAAFDAHLMKCTLDSRPPKDGSTPPAAITAEQQSDEEPPADDEEPVDAEIEPEPEPEPVTVPAEPALSDEEQLRLDAEAADRAAAAEYEREHGPEKPKPAADMSALGGKVSPDDPRLV
ncbi:MAG: hypothetical protein AB7R77_26270 [Ilumatobacteraceae bacterium]